MSDNEKEEIKIEETNDEINKESMRKFFKENKRVILYIACGLIIFFMILFIMYFIFGKQLAKRNLNTFSNIEEIFVEAFSEDLGYVCIDPGHGGVVPETAPDLQEVEKEDVLKLCLLLRDKLKEKNVKVIMTRTDDSSVELEERANIANEQEVDLFLSIHRNISDVGSDVCGVEVWAAYGKDEKEDIYGENIHDAMINSHIQNDRGLRYGSMTNPKENYKVNGLTNMPSVLIELGFMTNEEDNKLYGKYMDEYATNICDAIVKTLNDIKE
ncbi:MAG: N-acetylmuramoyl-L-alanine amidase [Clostridia bacterium]|nr:N-acetylmuramoyl-L-alanine amidase [Clostridia bacterium]